MAMQVEIDNAVATVTIDHPPTNLVDGPLFVALLDTLDRLEADESIRVVVFRSADPDFFLMHGDVHMLPRPRPAVCAGDRAEHRRGDVHPPAPGPRDIGLLDEIARGGGCELLCGLDLRFGSERSRVGQPEVALGILAGAGGTVHWSWTVGRGRALDILLTGRDVAADELLAIGWLTAWSHRPTSSTPAMPSPAESRRCRGTLSLPRNESSTLRPTSASSPRADAVAKLLSTGAHRERMDRFVAAGRQHPRGRGPGHANDPRRRARGLTTSE